MTTADTDLTRVLEIAHAAHERGDWRTAHETLSRARSEGVALPTEAINELGLSAWWLGATRESITLAEEAHGRFLAEGRVGLAADSATQVAIVAMLRGDSALGSGWLSRARRLLDGRDDCMSHGLVIFVDCLMALATYDLDTARAGAFRMQALGTRLPEPTLTSLGLMIEGVARVRSGQVGAGFSLLDEAMLPVIGGQVVPEFAGAIYCMVISTCTELADMTRAREWTDATEKWCTQFSDAVMYLGICRIHRAQLLALEGAWSRAEEEALRVCEELADVNTDVVAEGFYQVGEIRRLRGEVVAASEAYARARALGRLPQPGEALLHLAQGEPPRAWAVIERAFTECPEDPFTRSRLFLARVEIAIATGRTAEADRAAGELSSIAAQFDSPGLQTWAFHARGMVHLARADADEALTALSRACRGYQAVHASHDAARVRLLLADCRALLGHEDLARTERAAAATSLTALGAAPATLPPARGAVGDLTPRELEVLARVTAGASNREVGAALYITEKTVGRHLSNIYLKLGVGTRTAAAAWAHVHGIDPA